MFDIEASVAAYDRQWHTLPGLVKVSEDLDRYVKVIADTRPEVLVETGTWLGESARWFARLGLDVITVDVADNVIDRAFHATYLQGDSTDPVVVAQVAALVEGRRCMVVLDSDHSATHVLAEMYAYGPLVSPGCFLVVEDGICRHVPDTPYTAFGPLDALEQFPMAGWELDPIMDLHPVSHHPGGWLRRVAP